VSSARACQLLGISRRRLGYEPRPDDPELLERLMELARKHPRYGVRHLTAMLGLEGRRVNRKRVARLCRRHGLLLKQRRRRKRLGVGAGLPCRSEYPNHTWSYDFVEDRTESGRKLRILTIVDEFTRRCVAVEVEYRMNAKFLAQTLLRLFTECGIPEFLRSDNGPEFIARSLMRFLAIHGVQARHIDPGCPWQNGIDERFNGTLRDQCLNLETFHNRNHARALIKLFARDYNERRPHSSLGYQTPAQFAAVCAKQPPKGGLGSAQTRDLSTLAQDEMGDAGPTEARPAIRPVIHVGTPVASQQSRILRVDGMSVDKSNPAGKFPATVIAMAR
jgi:putative transposase